MGKFRKIHFSLNFTPSCGSYPKKWLKNVVRNYILHIRHHFACPNSDRTMAEGFAESKIYWGYRCFGPPVHSFGQVLGELVQMYLLPSPSPALSFCAGLEALDSRPWYDHWTQRCDKVQGPTGSAGLQSPTRPHHLPTDVPYYDPGRARRIQLESMEMNWHHDRWHWFN